MLKRFDRAALTGLDGGAALWSEALRVALGAERHDVLTGRAVPEGAELGPYDVWALRVQPRLDVGAWLVAQFAAPPSGCGV